MVSSGVLPVVFDGAGHGRLIIPTTFLVRSPAYRRWVPLAQTSFTWQLSLGHAPGA
jgi:hypothetical protein